MRYDGYISSSRKNKSRFDRNLSMSESEFNDIIAAWPLRVVRREDFVRPSDLGGSGCGTAKLFQ